MAHKPEDIKNWKVIETASIEQKTKVIFKKEEDTKLLRDIYNRLKSKLTTYPPDRHYFANPRFDIKAQCFWVISENGQIIVRAKYFTWAETCVIDKFYLASEKPTDLDL